MIKINGDARFTALQENGKGGYFLVFYEKKEDLGLVEKAAGIIEFSSWLSLEKWIYLQTSLVTQINRQSTHIRAENAKNN